MQNFGLIGVAGYVAHRHIQAIKNTGNLLVCAVDPHDSLRVLDSYFQDVHYFREIDRFDRFLDKQKRALKSDRIDWVSICSPNYLHDAHIRMALRAGSNVICEKPVVVNPWNLDALKLLEDEHERRVYTILQHRHHPDLIELKKQLHHQSMGTKHAVNLKYLASRGPWFEESWQGRDEKSGGLLVSKGVLLFDLMIWLFGLPICAVVHSRDLYSTHGITELERGIVSWEISMTCDDFPEEMLQRGVTSRYSLGVDGVSFHISGGLQDLHTVSYREILGGNGQTLDDARPALELVYQLHNADVGTDLIDLQHW